MTSSWCIRCLLRCLKGMVRGMVDTQGLSGQCHERVTMLPWHSLSLYRYFLLDLSIFLCKEASHYFEHLDTWEFLLWMAFHRGRSILKSLECIHFTIYCSSSLLNNEVYSCMTRLLPMSNVLLFNGGVLYLKGLRTWCSKSDGDKDEDYVTRLQRPEIE